MLQRKSYLLGGIDIPWKTFVRESNDTEERASEERVYRLRFHGSQARATYEEILSQECNAKQEPERVKPQRIERTVSLNVRTKKSQPSEDGNVKVTVNGILKAVEQRDLKYLLKHVTLENVNWADDFGWTPLMSAAYCGYLEIIELLLSRGANKRAKDRSGLTAAQLALKKNHLGVVALLRKKSENLNDKPLLEPVPSGASQDKAQEKSKSRRETGDPLAHKTSDSGREQSAGHTGFHCEVCDADFKHSTWSKHESSTLHIFNSKPKLSYVMYGISKRNKGYQMLLNTGWDEQNGLGPSGKGIKYPLKTCLKTDRKGLGQAREKEYRVTHFKAEDPSAVGNCSTAKQKCLKKRDRERLLDREARKERALRVALS